MKRCNPILFLFLICLSATGYAQQGVHGPRTVTALNTVVNEYTTLTASAFVGATTLTVGNSSLNANGRFASNLVPGDMIMIMHMQGIDMYNPIGIADTAYGRINNYFFCGNYEFCQVLTVPNATTITIDCGLSKDYFLNGGVIKAQVVRVPRYTSLTVNAGASLVCDDWNGTIGGVLMVEVDGNVVVNGSIDATGRGYRGGVLGADNNTSFGVADVQSTLDTKGADKGEGVAGYQNEYNTTYAGRYCRGAAMNAGGGGNAHNGGGGGGANAPNSSATTHRWTGYGIPDQSIGTWTTAWNLEFGTFSTYNTTNSEGGGRGGYSFSDQNGNATVTGPNNGGVWGGDARNSAATGLGGRPLDYTTGKLFMGGGGGAGDQNQSFGGNGGDGGGLIYLWVTGTISGTGSIISNGNPGLNAQGTPAINSYSGRDGAGGGGGGGTIVLNSVGAVSGVSVFTNGGNGGNQVMTAGALFVGPINEAEGPGGGGGGGYIAVSSGAPTRTSNGGNNGTTNSGALTEFTPNGATRGCPGTTNATITNFSINVTGTSICIGGTTTLTATLTGTVPPGAVIQWYANSTGGTPIGTGSTFTTPVLGTTTTYWVAVCPGGWWREPVTVTVGPTPVITVSPSNPTVCSGNPVTLTASGAVTYLWQPGNLTGTSIIVSPLTPTTYTVTGTVSAGCSGTTTVLVNVSPTPTVTAVASNTTICSGSSTTLTASGATSYVWNPGNFTSNPLTVTPIGTTTYTVTGTTSGCASTAQVTITVNPSPTVTATASNPTICAGTPITLTATGAVTYVWNPGNLIGNNPTVSPVATTTYTVVGTAANGCTSSTQVTVTVNSLPTITASANNTTICSGTTITLTATGGVSYVWNPGNMVGSPITVTPTSSITYTVTGVNVNGCTNTAQVAVTVNPTPTVTATANNPIICSGNSVTLTGTGATTYNWNPGNISGSPITITPSGTTTYTVTGTNAVGCTSTAQILVTVNPTPTLTATASNPAICLGGSTTLTVVGGNTYTWNPGNLNGNSVVVTPTVTTTYTVTGVSSNGCTSTTQVTVNVNTLPILAVSITNATICNGDSTTLSVSGASTYVWNPGNLSGSSITVAPSATTTYSVVGTAATGCTASSQITVSVNPLPVPTVSAVPATICVGDSSTLSASGGTNYNWNGGVLSNASGTTQMVNPSTTTTYTVNVTDGNGCSDSAQVTVNVNALPIVSAGIDQTSCSGDTITVSGTGGTTYVWNGGSLNNANGQTQSDNPSATTNYIMIATDVNGCSNSDTVVVNVNALPIVSAGQDVSVCPNTNVQLNASGASTYTWSPSTDLSATNISNPVSTPTATHTYVVTGIDANGCIASDTVVVTLGNNLFITAGADITICSGDTTTLNTSGGTIYTWSPSLSLGTPNNASTTAFPTATTTYVVQVSDANNCQGSDTVTVFVTGPVNLTASGSTTICIGQSATISANATNGSGTYTYTWSNSLIGAGPHTVSPTITTIYTVDVVDSLGCAGVQQTVTVTVNPPLTLANIVGSTICASATSSATLTASASGGDGTFSYLWLPGNQSTATITVNPATTTTYTVIVTDGCGTPPDTATVTVTVNQPPAPTITANTTIGCAPLCVNFTEQSSGACVTSSWDFGDGNTSTTGAPSNCYQNSGIYTVIYTCTDANGCVGSVTVNNMITVNSSPTAAFTSSVPSSGVIVVQTGNPQQVCFTDNSISATNWSWTMGASNSSQQSPCFNVTDTGTYCVQLIASATGGCEDTAAYCFRAVNEAVFSIPNVFTPNADGTNDLFVLTSTGVKDLHCEIYDRWGVKIYEWDGVTNGWDGRTSSGIQAVDGVYYYVITITDFSEKATNLKGFVHLIRSN
jgi:gliding motility-associated-like protein